MDDRSHDPLTAPPPRFSRLPLGPRHKDGLWWTGSAALFWVSAWVVLSGADPSANGWLLLTAVAALVLSAPHAWGWMRDGVPPPPDEGPVSLVFERGLGLWFLRLVVWRIPGRAGDLVLTTFWNVVGGRRAERSWRRTAPQTDDPDPVRPRGAARRPRDPGAAHDDEPITAEHPPTDGEATDEHARVADDADREHSPGVAGRAPAADQSYDAALRTAFPDPDAPRSTRRARLARVLQLRRDDELDSSA